MLTHESLLEAYVHAKDKCCPGLIHDIFEPNALLGISVADGAISFPPLARCNPAFAFVGEFVSDKFETPPRESFAAI